MSDMSDQIDQDRHPVSDPSGASGASGASGTKPITPIMLAAADFGVLDPADAHYGSMSVSRQGELSSLGGATAWLNSEPLSAADLRGRIVLVQFWTYTCINWLRTLPYVRAWAETYQDPGLVVIGAHAPEFPFEHDLENVRQAARDLRVAYPIAQDNDFAIWRGFTNHYWPALYLFDPQGNVRYHHFGEGEYVRSEIMIQRLLAEAGVDSVSVGEDLVSGSVEPRGVELAADWATLESPETYLGYEQAERFASPGGLAAGTTDGRRVYAAPAMLRLNQWALTGDWTMERGFVALNAANGRIVYRCHARDVNLVMGPAARGSSVRFRVFLDGQPVAAAHGSDVDERGNGAVSEQRTYQLIRQPAPVVDRQFAIEFLDAGVEAYAFTFG